MKFCNKSFILIKDMRIINAEATLQEMGEKQTMAGLDQKKISYIHSMTFFWQWPVMYIYGNV